MRKQSQTLFNVAGKMISKNSTNNFGYWLTMLTIKRVASIIFLIMVSGCTAQSAYKAAQGDGAGYKEIALATNHYRVQFKTSGSRPATAQKYVLMRAAELTIAQGYDWFIVEQRTTRILNEPEPFKSRSVPIVTRNCGLLGCRTHTQPSISSFETTATETLSIVEIRMGRGVRPEKESYDAY